MLRFNLCVCCTLLFWAGGYCAGKAEQPIHLKLKPERVRHAKAVEQEAIAKKDSLLLAEAYYLYGKTYVFAGDYPTAQEYFLKSLRIHEPRGDSFDLSRLYVRLSENETRLGHVQRALTYARLALQISRRIRSEKGLIRAYGALAVVYEHIWGDQLVTNRAAYNQVLSYYRKREQLCYKLNDTLGIAEVSVELGTLFSRINDPRAIPYLEKALQYFTLKNKDGVRVNAMLHLAVAYLVNNRPQLALATLQKAEKLYVSRKLNEYDIRLVLERNYIHYFQTVQQWKEAFEHQKKLNELEKSQLMADNGGAISRLNIEYETQKKETLLHLQQKELALRTETLQTQQRFTAAMSALFVITAGMSVVFLRLSRKNQRISRQNEVLVKEQNHRVKNILQIISSLLSLQSKRLTDEAAKTAIEESRLRVESMAILHRRLYDGEQLARVSLSDFIPELVSIVLRAYGCANVQTQYEIDTIHLSADKAVPLGLILTELTTNACKYAFPYVDVPRYAISCQLSQRRVTLEVVDNGPGWNSQPPEQLHESATAVQATVAENRTKTKGSFGLQLIQTQAEQLYGTFGFTENPSSTGVVFTLEFNV